MPLFKRFSRPRWFVDHTVLNWEGSRAQGRKLTYQALELGSNDLPVILVAALGFFTGSYILFVSGAVLPMLAYVYWNDQTSSDHDRAFNNVTVAGCIFGMVFFGVLADRFGRRKMYGHELIILMAGTMGVVMSSTGFTPIDDAGRPRKDVNFESYGSMNIASWLFFWRFLSGVGIGGEYPLSAIIASEFAPTRTRPRMLAMVFLMRPLGIAAGAIVSLVAVKVASSRHPGINFDSSVDMDESSRAVDQIWRWVVGLALVPALLTAALRFTTPESPRYTLDVLDDPRQAYRDTDKLKRFQVPSGFNSRPVISSDPIEPSAINTHKIEGADISISLDHMQDQSGDEVTIKQYFWVEGNWRYLVATSLAWFLADFPQYADSLSSAQTLSTIWFGINTPTSGTDPTRQTWVSGPSGTNANIFNILSGNSIRLLLMQAVPSIVGGLILVAFITRIDRRLLTWVMFLVSGCIYLLAGGVLQKTGDSSNSSINIALFALIQFANYFGIGPLTFMIPAELFPTKYRASCHGIAAACGKIGAVLASATLPSVAFGNVTHRSSPSTWLGYVFMIFAIPMFLGAGVSWLWIPSLQHKNGTSKTLEELAQGRKYVDEPDMPSQT